MTREPAEDDEDVFGDAWALIVEWRELKAAHPSRGRGSVVAGGPGAAADGGAGAAGGARDDAASGDVPAAGFRTGRPDRLAQARALRHA